MFVYIKVMSKVINLKTEYILKNKFANNKDRIFKISRSKIKY